MQDKTVTYKQLREWSCPEGAVILDKFIKERVRDKNNITLKELLEESLTDHYEKTPGIDVIMRCMRPELLDLEEIYKLKGYLYTTLLDEIEKAYQDQHNFLNTVRELSKYTRTIPDSTELTKIGDLRKKIMNDVRHIPDLIGVTSDFLEIALNTDNKDEYRLISSMVTNCITHITEIKMKNKNITDKQDIINKWENFFEKEKRAFIKFLITVL